MRESDLLSHIYAASKQMPDRVAIGPGDDMGAITVGRQTVLMTVDQVADGVHFRLENTPLDRVAHKAVVRNLSDVAAMAAVPLGAVVAASLPETLHESQANELFDAMREVAERYDCPLVGGDIAVWSGPLILTVTIFADPAGVEPVLRSSAQLGDHVYVTGQLGGAWDETGAGPHLTAEPRLAVARALALEPAIGLHAMIDLSDGLASDLYHIAEQSDVAAEIDTTAIPARPGSNFNGALTDGEDYELCFTASGAVPTAIEDVPITRIGRITPHLDRERITAVDAIGRAFPVTAKGWEHHAHG